MRTSYNEETRSKSVFAATSRHTTHNSNLSTYRGHKSRINLQQASQTTMRVVKHESSYASRFSNLRQKKDQFE